jgi:hypothetical protein
MSEKYGKKAYMSVKNVHQVRFQFRARLGLLAFAGNYSHDRRFAGTQWLCRCREEKEDESHLLSGRCPVYGPIREKYGSLENDEKLVDFFSEVLAKRAELEDQERG